MYHALFTHQPTEGHLVCFQAQDNFHVCVLFLIPHPPQALLFTFYFQPASFFLFYIAAISLSGYAIQTSLPALAPTNIILGHDNNEIQEACVQNMQSSSQNQFTGKCKGQSLDLGWGWFMKAWNSVDEQGLKDAPLLYPGEISSPRNSRLTTYCPYILAVCAKLCLMTLNSSSWSVQASLWPCSQGYPPPPIKVIFGHFLTVKTSLKSPVALCQGNSADGSNTNPAGYPSMKRPGESEYLHGDSSFPVGRDTLMHLKTHTWKERAEQPFSPHYYLIF